MINALTTPNQRLHDLLQDVTPGASMVDLSAAIPNWPLPGEILGALRRGESWTINPSAQGIDELNRAFAAWLQTTFALDAPAAGAATIPTTGSKEGLASAVTAALWAGRKKRTPSILVPDGSYHAIAGAAQAFRARVERLPLAPGTSVSMAFRALDPATLDQADVLAFPFPAGLFAPADSMADLQSVLELAARHQITIIADECMIELFDSVRPASFLDVVRTLPAMPDNLIVSSSLSKRSFASALRSGCLTVSRSMASMVLGVRRQISPLVPTAVQCASASLWLDRSRSDAVRAHVRQARQLWSHAFGENAVLPANGLYGWIRVDNDLDAARRLFAAGVRTMPRSLLSIGPSNSDDPSLRVALHHDHDRTDSAIAAIQGCLASMRV